MLLREMAPWMGHRPRHTHVDKKRSDILLTQGAAAGLPPLRSALG